MGIIEELAQKVDTLTQLVQQALGATVAPQTAAPVVAPQTAAPVVAPQTAAPVVAPQTAPVVAPQTAPVVAPQGGLEPTPAGNPVSPKGVIWDARIHQKDKNTKDDGEWKFMRKYDKELAKQILELQQATPQTAAAAPVTTAVAPPVVVAPNAAVAPPVVVAPNAAPTVDYAAQLASEINILIATYDVDDMLITDEMSSRFGFDDVQAAAPESLPQAVEYFKEWRQWLDVSSRKINRLNEIAATPKCAPHAADISAGIQTYCQNFGESAFTDIAVDKQKDFNDAIDEYLEGWEKFVAQAG